MSFINFESGRVKEQLRHEKRKAQEAVLEKAEEDYKRRKEMKLKAAERGEDKWMLPSLDAQLQPGSSKKKKKQKKERKAKKEKKHKHKRKSSSSDESSAEESWEEKPSAASGQAMQKSATDAPKERDEWMTLPALFPCVTRDQMRARNPKEPTEAEKEALKKKFLLDNPGQSDRELNPYWKDGGQGLPEMQDPEPESLSLPAGSAGDHGLKWLRRALQRVEEQSKEQGRSMEDIAAERWGSLEKLKNLLAEAEQRCRNVRRGGRGRGRGGRVQGPKPRPHEYEDWREDPSAGESSVQSEEVGNKSRYRAWLGIKEPVVPEKPPSEEEESGSDTDDEMVKELKRQFLENERKEEEAKRQKELDNFKREAVKEEESEEEDTSGKIIFKARNTKREKDLKAKTLQRLAAFGRRPPVRSAAERAEDSDEDDKAIEAWKEERRGKEDSDDEGSDAEGGKEKEKLPPVVARMEKQKEQDGKKGETSREGERSEFQRILSRAREEKRVEFSEAKMREDEERRERNRQEGVERDDRREGRNDGRRRDYEMFRDRRRDNEKEERRRGGGDERRREWDRKNGEGEEGRNVEEGGRWKKERERSRDIRERDDSESKKTERDGRNGEREERKSEDRFRRRDQEKSRDDEERKEKPYGRDSEERRRYDRQSERRKEDRERCSDRGSPQEGRRRTEIPNYIRKPSSSETYEKLPPRKIPAFRRPDEDDVTRKSHPDILGNERRYQSSSSRNWRKKDFQKAEDEDCKIVETPREKASVSIPSPELMEEQEEEEEKEPEPVPALTDAEMNALAAKLMKAEILGNQALVSKLKQQMESARIAREQRKTTMTAAPTTSSKQKVEVEDVILTRRDAKGFVRPVAAPEHPEPAGGRRKAQKVATHSKEGLRERYFPDDDRYSLENMFQREKMTSVEEANEEFVRLAAKGSGRTESEYDLDDLFVEKAMREKPKGKLERLERDRAIREYKRVERSLDSCLRCFDSPRMLKHLLIALGSKVYLSLPAHQSLAEGHCLLSPVHHVPCGTQLDEDVWEEMTNFRKALVAMFAKQDLDCVFFESAMHLNRFPHMMLQCVPLSKEVGDTAPIYFKKAIMESEMEWSMNKKLVDLKGKGLRRAVPKGLPYFAVDFGLDDGFAHVIEDEKLFPENFAQEIIGGMLDLDHGIWRKERKENFDTQRKKVLQFEQWWKPFDFTKKSEVDDSSTSTDSD